MIVTKTALPRRTFLRGLGAALALPLLDAMVPALSPDAGADARQLGAASGLRLHPDGHERGGMDAADARARITELSPSLLALTPVLDQRHGGHATSSCATPTPPATTRRPTARS